MQQWHLSAGSIAVLCLWWRTRLRFYASKSCQTVNHARTWIETVQYFLGLRSVLFFLHQKYVEDACNLFAWKEIFISSFFTDEHVYRGCLSDSSDHRLLCDQDQKKNRSCITCEKSGCNDTPKIRNSTLSCIQCKASHECAFGFERDSAGRCKEGVRLGLEESCYVYFRNGMANHKIQRLLCAGCYC